MRQAPRCLVSLTAALWAAIVLGAAGVCFAEDPPDLPPLEEEAVESTEVENELPPEKPAARPKPPAAGPVPPPRKVSPTERVLAVAKTAVAVSPRADRTWRINDEACVLRDELEIACGKITKVLPKGAILRLSSQEEPPLKGDKVAVRESGSSRRAPAMMSSKVSVVATSRAVHFSAGCVASPTYVIPAAQIEVQLAGPLSVGVQSGYLTSSTTNFKVTGIPVLATLAYHSRGDFEGLWGQLGVGAYLFGISSATSSESPTSLAAYMTIGYRLAFWKLLSAGIGVGGQYLPSPDSRNVELDASSVQPVALIGLGLKF